MQIAVRIGIILFGLLVLAAGLEAAFRPMETPEVVTAQLAVSQDLAKRAVDMLGSTGKWTSITIEKAGLTDFALALHYATPPDAPEAIAADTKSAVAAVLYQLTLASHHPTDEHVTIVAQALYDHDGHSTVLGLAHYDYATDRIFADPVPL